MDKSSLTRHIIGNSGNDPLGWIIRFDILGWTITSSEAQISTMITEEQAKVLIRMIRNAWKYPINAIP